MLEPVGMSAVLGVDISAGSWAGVLLTDAGAMTSLIAGDVDSLVGLAGDTARLRAIAIDIPIALPTDRVRRCDEAARAVLKARGSTLFTTPCLAALRAPNFAEALRVNKAVLGRGLSQQAYRLGPKILDVHDWLAGGVAVPVIECHPEVSFAVLNGAAAPTPVKERKTSWQGMRRRIALLAGAGLDVNDLADGSGRIGTDDMLDAAVAAWTARRFADGGACCFPADAVDGEPAVWA